MSSNSSRFPPRPNDFTTWQAWATSYTAFMSGGGSVKQAVEPAPVMLSSAAVVDGNVGAPRAAADGILMFDQNEGAIVFSYNGAWHKVTSTPVIREALETLMTILAVSPTDASDVLDKL